MAIEKQVLLSEDVQEIIERMPPWIVRYGLTLLLLTLLMILCLAWFIKYPDVIKAAITITTSPPPTELVSRTEGTLQLLVKENSFVDKDQVIAFIASNVELQDVVELESSINESSELQAPLPQRNFKHLGLLQTFYNDYATAVEELQLYENNDLISKQIIEVHRQIKSIEALNMNLGQQLTLTERELRLAKEKLDMDSTLLGQQVIAKVDYNITEAHYIAGLKAFKAMELSLINNQAQIHQLEGRMSELEIEKTERTGMLRLKVKATRQTLASRIKDWRGNYLFVSPFEGRLVYLRFLENDMFISTNTALFSVVPDQSRIYGRAELPVAGSGKVKTGQRVNIRLENYPFEQYGMLKGKIESIAMLPNEGVYMVRVMLPNGLQTSYGQTLPFTQQLQGETEIITEDLRLLERFFFQFRKLFKSN